ncbi:MAG: sigma 54-interacting transcriptional regulator [Alistipes indistinctus]
MVVLGANGTGKELVAHALHDQSRRAGGPFIEVSCAAIPSTRSKANCSGMKGGVYFGDPSNARKFEQADGGTLFLDEIGDMSLSARPKCCVLCRRIGLPGRQRQGIRVDVRVVAATNKNLRHEIELGNFREDLYHRLSVIVVRVPTLKERAEDIPALTDYFIQKICAEYGMERKDRT